MILALLAGGVLGYFGMMTGRSLATGNTMPLFAAVRDAGLWWLPIWWVVAVLLHELGHMLAGHAQGMRLLFLTVGPVRARQTVSGLRFEWAGFSHGFGGLTAMMPNLSAEPSRQLRVLVLGGPLVSLLLAGLGACLMLTDGVLRGHGVMVLLINGFILLITIVPMQVGPFLTDGAQYLALKRGSQEVLIRHQVMALYGQSLSGVRPHDWDPAILAALSAQTTAAARQQAVIAYMRYQHALDAGDIGAAESALNQLCERREEFGAGYAQAIAAEAAFFHARYRRDIESSQHWLDQSQGGTVEPALRALAAAAVASLKGDHAGAQQLARQGLSRLPEGASAGINALLETELHALLRDIEAMHPEAMAS